MGPTVLPTGIKNATVSTAAAKKKLSESDRAPKCPSYRMLRRIQFCRRRTACTLAIKSNAVNRYMPRKTLALGGRYVRLESRPAAPKIKTPQKFRYRPKTQTAIYPQSQLAARTPKAKGTWSMLMLPDFTAKNHSSNRSHSCPASVTVSSPPIKEVICHTTVNNPTANPMGNTRMPQTGRR